MKRITVLLAVALPPGCDLTAREVADAARLGAEEEIRTGYQSGAVVTVAEVGTVAEGPAVRAPQR